MRQIKHVDLSIIGKQLGELVVKSFKGINKNKQSTWECQCNCGKLFIATLSNIRKQKSCGCSRKKINLVGRKFNMLTVLKEAPKQKDNSANFWVCKCDCGKEKIIRGSDLQRGKTKSCGCGFRRKNIKHGMSKTSEYTIWVGIIQRCTNPKKVAYPYYGGRGIKVCDRWSGKDGFLNFYKDVGPRPTIEHSIDRIDPNGNYEPSNCRWATPLEQWVNKRKPGTHFTFRRYQVEAQKTAIYPHQNELMGLVYCTLSISSEAGELCGKVQKLLRDGPVEINAEFRRSLILEAGDVLWNVCALANELGITLDQIARMNLKKLESRKNRNVIQGSGDNR